MFDVNELLELAIKETVDSSMLLFNVAWNTAETAEMQSSSIKKVGMIWKQGLRSEVC